MSERETCACGGMGKWLWAGLALAVAGVLWVKHADDRRAAPVIEPAVGGDVVKIHALPRLVDLGAGKCVPCKMMAPILEELKNTYAGSLEVEFIDVWKNREAGRKYGINVIPTQIFYDAQGKELFRHEGFYSKEDIVRKWKEYGVEFSEKPEDRSQPPPGLRRPGKSE